MQDYKAHFKKNYTLAYPVMLSQLGHVLVGVVDSLMVGQLGVFPLAAVTLANGIFYFFMTFGLGISYAITPLVAEADGQGDKVRSGNVLKHGILINTITAAILFLAIWIMTGQLDHFGQDENVVEQAIPYLFVIGLSLIPFMLFQTFRQFCEGLSETKLPMYVSIIANVLNVVLNYILIFGKLGFEPMGLLGAGVATFISRTVMAIILAVYLYSSSKYKPYWAGIKLAVLNKLLVVKMLKIGVPAGLQFIFEVGAFVLAAFMMGWINAKTLAAHQIAINLASISYMMATGLAAAATIRVGNQLGRKDIPTMRTATNTIFIMVAIFMTSCAILFVIGRFWLPTIYIDDNEVIGIASSLIAVAALFQLSDGIQVVGLGALRGMSDVKVPTYITFVAYWVLGLPIGYVLTFELGMGPNGIWFGLTIGLTIAAVLVYRRFNILSKRMLPKAESDQLNK